MKKMAKQIVEQLELLLEMEVSACIFNDEKQLEFVRKLYKKRTNMLKTIFNSSSLTKEELIVFKNEAKEEIAYGELLLAIKNYEYIDEDNKRS